MYGTLMKLHVIRKRQGKRVLDEVCNQAGRLIIITGKDDNEVLKIRQPKYKRPFLISGVSAGQSCDVGMSDYFMAKNLGRFL
jgi:hypothetical protein